MANIVLKNSSGISQTYSGVSAVNLKNTGGTYETFIQPAGTIELSEAGSYNVAVYASALVTASGGGDRETATVTIVNSGGAAAPFTAYYALSGVYSTITIDDSTTGQFLADASSVIALKAPYTVGVSAAHSSPVYQIAGGDYSGNETYVLFPTQDDTFTDHQ